MDQLQGMRVFTRVAELGSFARAASALDLSRAMASSYVAQLEKHLGTRLLHRTTRKVSVSPQGAVYLEHCKRILAEIAAADDQLRLARNRPQGKLRVDVPVAFGKYLLLPAIPLFTQRYPDIALEVRFNDRYVDVAAERVDVAVRVGKVTSPDMIAKRIATSRLLTCASPKYLAEHGVPRTPEDLRKHRLIGHLRGDGSRPAEWQFRQGAGTRSVKLPMALSFNTVDALTMSALEGQGMVQQLDLLVSSYLTEGRLVEVLREHSCEGPPLSVIYQRATQHLAKVRVFAEFATDLMRNYEARVRRAAEPASR
ncbi:MAG TPA: LysR substrate-binding domain-containing protein [Steroidobacteraceae bacterium]|jgi:DNA-binding transcriptional LysR family regulator|nr:LysR substrate-binding domain-containing protein [Steroidobacteraceae bacterium]